MSHPEDELAPRLSPSEVLHRVRSAGPQSWLSPGTRHNLRSLALCPRCGRIIIHEPDLYGGVPIDPDLHMRSIIATVAGVPIHEIHRVCRTTGGEHASCAPVSIEEPHS